MRQTAIATNGEQLKKDGKNVYYYPHYETACYYCIVNATDASADTLDKNESFYNKKLIAYYNAMAREKFGLVKLSNYINESDKQTNN